MQAPSRDGSSPALTGERRWYAVQTRAYCEVGADQQLRRQGFVCFLPQVAKTVRHARKLRTVRAPFFPGYLFVGLDLAFDRWRSVNGTFGVARLVMVGDRPIAVPAGVVEALRDLIDETGLVRLDGGLRIGQKVEVTAGPFAQALGELERLDGAGRVRVLLDIMGGKVPVIIDRAQLRAA
ncbi:transcription termination/antitermination protein NusG [Labrys monachus]|uniref:Transcriptional antiterminator RfaH n=1 Tax=Labrys monachus TaxID=217067 RepID=A0ABU0FL00_9HYPH|nr:transcriptional activator RfaH [Labrys monachus]MDQ0394799.1 transcriptional antiterminator RfaH [Labrys monachus]